MKPTPDLTNAQWRRSSQSGDGVSVEVAFVDGMIAMRASDNPSGPALIFTPSEWDAFVGGVNDGEFDPVDSASAD